MRTVYLDNAATTPLDRDVIEVMIPYMENHFGNPSSTHHMGRKNKTAIELSRRSIAKCLNAHPSEIYFTSGGTEADNLAIMSSVYDLGCKTIITTQIEHSAVIKTSEKINKTGDAVLHFVRLKKDGHVDLGHLEELLKTNDKCFVSLMHGNNELANILPLKEVGELCEKYKAIFHSDTVQTMAHFPFDLKDLNVHFITGAAHKFHGPKGIGFLYVRKNLNINALITGGGQERQLRGGTENIYGIVGMAKAMEKAYEHLDDHKSHVLGLKTYMCKELTKNFDGIEFNGDCENPDSLYTVLNVTFPEHPNSSMLLFLLDLEGICASGGSACSSGATKGSHVLTAIDAIKENRASIRFSFSRFTQKEDIDYAVEKLKVLCADRKVIV